MKSKERVQTPLIVSERDDSWPQVFILSSEIANEGSGSTKVGQLCPTGRDHQRQGDTDRSVASTEVSSLVPAVCQDGIKFLRKLVGVSFIQYNVFIFTQIKFHWPRQTLISGNQKLWSYMKRLLSVRKIQGKWFKIAVGERSGNIPQKITPKRAPKPAKSNCNKIWRDIYSVIFSLKSMHVLYHSRITVNYQLAKTR